MESILHGPPRNQSTWVKLFLGGPCRIDSFALCDTPRAKNRHSIEVSAIMAHDYGADYRIPQQGRAYWAVAPAGHHQCEVAVTQERLAEIADLILGNRLQWTIQLGQDV